MKNMDTYKQDLIYAIDAAETCGTNAELLDFMVQFMKRGTEAAEIITCNIIAYHKLHENESFKTHMRNEFTYYANISPRTNDVAETMQILENIWEMTYNM